MTKKISVAFLFALGVLGLALTLAGPAAALPPPCTCPSCAIGNASCSLPDHSITTCGVYFGSHCTGPNLVAPRSTAATAPQSCTAVTELAAWLAPVASVAGR